MEKEWDIEIEETWESPVQPVKASPFADSPYVTAFTEPEYQPPVTKKKKKRSKAWLWMLMTVILVAAGVAITAVSMNAYWSRQLSALSESTGNRLSVMQNQVDAMEQDHALANSVDLEEGPMTPGQVYAANVDAVVAIVSYDGQYENFGSGFVISQNGYVVTNYHVVADAESVSVLLYDNSEHEAKLIGYDETNDIALLKMEGEGFACVRVGSSDKLVVGDKVVAIGNPLGELTSTLTVGYISAKDRIVTTDGSTINMLQTDAAINSGNSGGPLFNMQGEVIGITTAKYSGNSASGVSIEGIGFAIPIDDVFGMIEDLRDYGYIKGAYLGIMVRDVSPDSVRDGLPAGALVVEVTPGYCAEAAGLQEMDIIIDLGGYPITNTTELIRYLRKFEGGDETTVTVYRGGKQITLTVTLDEKPRETTAATEEEEEVYLYPGDEGFEEWYEDFIEREKNED